MFAKHIGVISLLAVLNGSLLPAFAQDDKAERQPKPVLRILGKFGAWTQRVIFSPDGKTLYCSFRSEKEKPAVVRALDVESGKIKQEFPGGHQIALSPDGKILAINRSQAKRVSIWATDPFRELGELMTENAALAAEFLADGKILAVTNASWSENEGVVEFWDWDKKSIVRSFKVGEHILGMVAPAKGKSILINFGDGEVGVWSSETGVEKRRLHSPTNRTEDVRRLNTDRLEDRVLGASAKAVYIWQPEDWKLVKTIPIQVKGPWPESVASDGKRVYVVSPTNSPFGIIGELKSYDIDTGDMKMIYRLLGFRSYAMKVSPDSKKLIVGTANGDIVEFQLDK